MDSLHFCIAIVPLSVYLFLIGGINLSPRPFVTTGARDLAALAIAISGFMIVGPMELFLPELIASIVGGWVWLPMLTLYMLVVTLVVLLMRPRIVIYNISAEQLRPILKQVVFDCDDSARWAGDCVVIPGLGVQLALESSPGVRNLSLTSVGADQNLEGWNKLKLRLASELANNKQAPNAQGMSFLFLSAVMIAAVTYSLLTGRQEIAQAVRDMLRM